MKSVRRNAELTSFTSYTSAVAHIINITEKSYSSSLGQHMGERCGIQRGGEEDRKEGRYCTICDVLGQHRWGMWSISSSLKLVFSSMTVQWILLATTVVWLLRQPACSEAILHASVTLFLIWKDMIWGKNQSLSFVQHVTVFFSVKDSYYDLQVSECDPSLASCALCDSTRGLAFCHTVS